MELDLRNIAMRPMALKAACGALSARPGFVFESVDSSITYEVKPPYINIVAHSFDDDVSDYDDGKDVLRAALKRHAYGHFNGDPSSNRWEFAELGYELRTGVTPGEQYWKDMGKLVSQAYLTVLCDCKLMLCDHGGECSRCALVKEGLSASRAPATCISEMAAEAMEGTESEGWKDKNEAAGACTVCTERRAKKLRLDPCGHSVCGVCASKMTRDKLCHACRDPVDRVQLVFSA